jgi:hypothetical protein
MGIPDDNVFLFLFLVLILVLSISKVQNSQQLLHFHNLVILVIPQLLHLYICFLKDIKKLV